MRKPDRWWLRSPSMFAKRVTDVVGAATGLVVAAPVLALASYALRREGRVLFSQARPGYKAETFTIHKLRTMRDPAEGEVWFRSDAERVTPLGHFLRKTSIDELPELWNVLRGDMSLVGPRPLLIEYLDKYTPEEARRHDMPPGITGWAQVNGRQSIPFSERIRLDLWYVDNWRFALDLKILAQTLSAVIFHRDDVHVGQDVDDVDDLGLSSDRERIRPENPSEPT